MVCALLKVNIKHPCHTRDDTLVGDHELMSCSSLEMEMKTSVIWDVMLHLHHLKLTDMFRRYVS